MSCLETLKRVCQTQVRQTPRLMLPFVETGRGIIIDARHMVCWIPGLRPREAIVPDAAADLSRKAEDAH